MNQIFEMFWNSVRRSLRVYLLVNVTNILYDGHYVTISSLSNCLESYYLLQRKLRDLAKVIVGSLGAHDRRNRGISEQKSAWHFSDKSQHRKGITSS